MNYLDLLPTDLIIELSEHLSKDQALDLLEYIPSADQNASKELILEKQLLNIMLPMGYLVQNMRKWNDLHPNNRVDIDKLLTTLINDNNLVNIITDSMFDIRKILNLNFRDSIANAIIYAGTQNYYEVMKILVLDQSTDSIDKDTDQDKKNTAIRLVMNQGNLKMVKLLLSR